MAVTNETWAEILREAVRRGVDERRGPVSGARLRQFVVKVAAEQGIEYPPADNPTLKFGRFLEQHSSVVALRKQPEADVLVAPAEKPELLVEIPIPHRPLPGLRQDIFEAFTRIRPDKQPWYDKDRDAVVWHPANTTPDGAQYLKIPSPVIEEMRQARKKFAAEQTDDALRTNLEKAADSPAGLSAFSAVVRDAGLSAVWHQFRIRLLVDRVGSWATDAGLQWRDAWLTDGSARIDTPTAPMAHSDWRKVLSMLEALDQQELARISVPMDLVLKLLQRK